MRKFIHFFLTFGVLLLVGCGALSRPDTTEIEDSSKKIQEMEEERKAQFKAEKPAVTVHSHNYFGSRRIEIATPEPEFLMHKIVLVSKPLSIFEVVERLNQVVGIPVNLTHGLQSLQDDKSRAVFSREMPIDYEGTVKGFLNAMSAFYGVNWETQGESINIFKVKTRSFSLASAIGKLTVKDLITNHSSSATSGDETATSTTDSEGVQSTELTASYSVWDECQNSIKAMLSQDGTVVMNLAAGTIIVTDVPSILDAVAVYVDDLNQRLSRQVALSVHIYSLTISNAHDQGFSVASVFSALESELRLSMVNAAPFASNTAIGGVTAGIIESARGRNTKPWAGSEAFLRALKKQGKAALLSSGSGITMHQQPLPIQVVKRTGYLKEVSKTVTESVGTTSELTAGTVTTGLAMKITPNIIGDGSVVLQYSLSLSSLDALQRQESGDQSIQTPEVSTRSFMQRVKVRVGSTVLLGGFEQLSQDHTNESGILAGLSSVKSERSMIVIAIDVQDANEG